MSLTLGAAERGRHSLSARLAVTREPIIRFGLIAGFLFHSRRELDTPDQWFEFASPLLKEFLPAATPSLLGQLPPEVLNALETMAAGVPDRDAVSPFLADLQTARLHQMLYVGDVKAACSQLDLDPETIGEAGSPFEIATRIVTAITRSGNHDRTLGEFVMGWRRESQVRDAAQVHVLLVSPEEALWPSHGILTRCHFARASKHVVPHLQFEHLSGSVDAAMLALDTARRAATIWLERELDLPSPADATLRLAGVEDAIEGPSLGLAIAGLCICDVVMQSSGRQRFRFPGTVAVTGALDSEGRVQRVAGIREKVTRAFFSPITYLAVPAEQAVEAEAAVAALALRFPRRTLSVIPVRHLDDLFSQRRLVHGYRVPLAVHALHQLDRMPRWSQAAIVLVLVAALAFKFFPVTRPWLDRTPVFWDASNGKELVVMNRDNVVLWRFRPGSEWNAGYVGYVQLCREQPPLSESEMWKLGSADARFCVLADMNGDHRPEVFFHCETQDSTRARKFLTELYCLSSTGRVLWKRTDWMRDTSPLGVTGLQPMQIYRSLPVDWKRDGHANLVVSLCDASGQGRGLASLEELDGRTGVTVHTFWHGDWFFSLQAVPREEGQDLWAGTLDTPGHPELFVFRDSVRTGVWPCADTAGFSALRFPIADIFLAKGKRAWVHSFGQPDNGIVVRIANLEVWSPSGYGYPGYTFRMSPNLKLMNEPMVLYQWGFVEEFVRAGLIPRPQSPEEWLRRASWPELWTGTNWIAFDTASAPPDPYPVYTLDSRHL